MDDHADVTTSLLVGSINHMFSNIDFLFLAPFTSLVVGETINLEGLTDDSTGQNQYESQKHSEILMTILAQKQLSLSSMTVPCYYKLHQVNSHPEQPRS